MRKLKNFLSSGTRKLKPGELETVYRVLRKKFGHQHWWPGDTPFEIMVGAVLTQNTAWTNVEKAIDGLKRAGKLNPQAILKMPHESLARKIKPAGYFNVKSRRLKNFVRFFVSGYGANTQRLFRERKGELRRKLLTVNGIGRETADSILLYAGAKRVFVIDAYTKRIFSRHGLMNESEDYDAWRAVFEKFLPQSTALYNDFHAQIVQLAKKYCKTKAVCEECPLQSFFSSAL